MSRPRHYATHAARQAAYRHRMHETTIWVNRAPFARMDQAVETLYQALRHAATHDHRLAHRLLQTTPLDTLEAVVAWVTAQLLPAPPGESEETNVV